MPRYIELAPQLVRLYRLNLDCKEVIKEFLLTAVPADVVERKKGKWKDVDSEAWDGKTFGGRCTICGFYHVFIDGHTAQYNFCPQCGAEMEKDNAEIH